MKNETSTRFVVREPRNLEELEALLRLRYSVFQKSELRFLLQENETGIDVDAWDKHAWHLGLYKQTSTNCQPVGYMRFIHNGPQRAHLVYALGRKYPTVSGTIAKVPCQSYPFLGRSNSLQSKDILERFESLAQGKLAETSRLAMLESERSHQTCRFLLESGIAICNLEKGISMVFEVISHHAKCYEKYGFRTIYATNYNELSSGSVLLYASTSDLEQKHLPRLHHMAKAFKEGKEIWLNPDDPENYHAPINTETTAQHHYQLVNA